MLKATREDHGIEPAYRLDLDAFDDISRFVGTWTSDLTGWLSTLGVRLLPDRSQACLDDAAFELLDRQGEHEIDPSSELHRGIAEHPQPFLAGASRLGGIGKPPMGEHRLTAQVIWLY